MRNTLKAEIQALVQQRNESELARRRDYHDSLAKQRRTGGETLEEHIKRHADLIRIGPAATPIELAQLADRVGACLPQELSDFYREVGGLRGQRISIFPPSELLARFADTAPRYQQLSSIGLTRMMRLAWDNDRFEFDPENGLLSQAEADTLDARYRCIGWLGMDDDESHTYLYFDDEGRFGELQYHQDCFDELLEEHLRPMLQKSTARMKLEAIVRSWLVPPDPPSGHRLNDIGAG